MLRVIASVVRDTYLLSEENIALAVLAKVEELGMKPPTEDTCPVLFTKINVWEKEDA